MRLLFEIIVKYIEYIAVIDVRVTIAGGSLSRDKKSKP